MKMGEINHWPDEVEKISFFKQRLSLVPHSPTIISIQLPNSSDIASLISLHLLNILSDLISMTLSLVFGDFTFLYYIC